MKTTKTFENQSVTLILAVNDNDRFHRLNKAVTEMQAAAATVRRENTAYQATLAALDKSLEKTAREMGAYAERLNIIETDLIQAEANSKKLEGIMDDYLAQCRV